MTLYTRTGDEGETSLADGSRVAKDDPRPEAYGAIDELNAHLGLARCACREPMIRERLTLIQRELFLVGAELAGGAALQTESSQRIDAERVSRMEAWIDDACRAVPPLSGFILSGDHEAACRLDIARTVCRRAERRIVGLSRSERISQDVLRYVNRLSDLLFAWSRQVNYAAGVGDVPVNVTRR